MKLRTTVCREGWLYLLVLAMVFGLAVSREVNLLLMLAGILVGPLVFNWRAVRLTLRGLQVRRSVPQAVCAGDLLLARLSLANTRRRWGSWAVVVEDQIQRETGPQGEGHAAEKPLEPGVLFPYVRAGQSRKAVYRGRLTRRGRYRLGPLRLSTRFPFGLLKRTIAVPETESLVVFPRLGKLVRGWITRHHESFTGTHRRERRHGADGDFYGVRPWRPGDSRRWIHARSSARLGQPVVCQFEQPRSRDLAVLVDLWQPRRPGPRDLQSVELAVSFAATIVAEVCRRGGSDLYVATAAAAPEQPKHTAGPASAALLQDAMRQLATAEAGSEAGSQDRLTELLAEAAGRIERGTEIVLISTRPVDTGGDPGDDTHGDPRLARLWAELSRRAAAGRIRSIDASKDEELARYFQPE